VNALDRVREICLALPCTTEKIAWGEPTWRVGKIFVMMSTYHHGDPHLSIVCNAAEGVQETLVRAEPKHFYRPPYVGGAGWIGVRLDTGLGWNVVASLIRDAYRATAPKKILKQFEESSRRRFTAKLVDGHKGLAVEVPFDPGRKEVSGMLNGIPFDSVVARRAKKFWLLVEKDLAVAAGVGEGDEVEVVLELIARDSKSRPPQR
jgi:hypothetical protein